MYVYIIYRFYYYEQFTGDLFSFEKKVNVKYVLRETESGENC